MIEFRFAPLRRPCVWCRLRRRHAARPTETTTDTETCRRTPRPRPLQCRCLIWPHDLLHPDRRTWSKQLLARRFDHVSHLPSRWCDTVILRFFSLSPVYVYWLPTILAHTLTLRTFSVAKFNSLLHSGSDRGACSATLQRCRRSGAAARHCCADE